MLLLLVSLGVLVPCAQAHFFTPEGGFSMGGVQVSVDQRHSVVSPGGTAVYDIMMVNDSEFPCMVTTTVLSLSDWKTSLTPASLVLGPNEVARIRLSVTAPRDMVNGSNEVIILYAISAPAEGMNLEVPATTFHTEVREGERTVNYVGAIAVVSLSVALALFLSTDAGKYGSAVVIGPLYSRIHRDRILQNGIRNDVFNLIRSNPGKSFSEIKRSLDIGNGVLAHHIRTLERERYIKSRKDGLHRRFFLRDQPIPNIVLNEAQKDILRYLLEHQGGSQTMIAAHLGVSRQTVNYHISAMEGMGAVRVVKSGRISACYPLVRPGPEGSET